ncbi:MAG: bifunctional riboflavin kinase/FAD synthetase [Dehalococcoidia bacterium]|nr:MAG: bifunctional riboflavin kinase/FAD synthetase [Dehalococcoidia bacterium]
MLNKIMTTERELSLVKPEKDTLLTVGIFDGVHRGHQHLLAELVKEAGKKRLLSGVVTFRQHPQAVLMPGSKLSFLTNLGERERLLKDAGVGFVVALSFTRELARLGPERFVDWLRTYLRMRGLVIGYDFALGSGRAGDTESLQRLGQVMGFSVRVVAPVTVGDEVVSSTAIREALERGDMAKVSRLLGRPFKLSGRVVTGASRGKGLGYPTANLGVDPCQALPADGVYVSLVHIGNQSYPAMTYIGRRPTFGEKQEAVENYLLDWSGDLYDREITIEIKHYLRGDRKFESAEELSRQIAADVAEGRRLLTKTGKN